jgi:hypothetical protein
MQYPVNLSETLEVFSLMVNLDVDSLGSTENVQNLFELLPFTVEPVRLNSRDSFHTLIAYFRSATSLAIMDAPSF